MAIDNLNYYSAGLPAGQQTDKYSSQPGCLKSKNLDIFSSSKSVKATAWTEPTALEGGVIAEEGGLVLKTDGKVYERTALGDVLFVDPADNFPGYPVSYTGESGPYADAQLGTPTAMTVASEGDEWNSFLVYTDRASFVYSKVKYVVDKDFGYMSSRFTYDTSGPSENGYIFTKNATNGSIGYIEINISNAPFASIPLRVYAEESASTNTHISLTGVKMYYNREYYDASLDAITEEQVVQDKNISFTGSITDGILLNVPIAPTYNGRNIRLEFSYTKVEGASDYGWSGTLYIDMNGGPSASHRMSGSTGDYNYYYSYLPIRNRELVDIGVYGYSTAYWLKGITFQALYKWISSWVTESGKTVLRYDFVADMGWENAPGMDVIGLIVWNEQAYMIGNLNGDGYIIPCDLTGGTGTAYVAYGCTFSGVTNIDYLLYLVGQNRGISTLWVFNQQELVPIIGGNKESGVTDLVNTDEQYNFDGHIVNWRKNLILTTSDNRVFQYGTTYGGKGGSFIHQLPSNAVITGLKANGNNLEIDYSITVNDTTTNYSIIYQDDVAIKNYNTEWEAVYPIVLGNHLLEKEESDLYVSYILPSSTSKLEFWGMANHYHFWTFTSEDNVTLSDTENYKIKGAGGTYALKFIEKNGNQYTFRLEGDLPIQTTSEEQIIDSNNAVVINYSEYNHFRKIGAIETDSYCEGEFRFHNLNNKLELPKSHSLQIMVKGKGNQNYTPELFALDLVANQRERG